MRPVSEIATQLVLKFRRRTWIPTPTGPRLFIPWKYHGLNTVSHFGCFILVKQTRAMNYTSLHGIYTKEQPN